MPKKSTALSTKSAGSSALAAPAYVKEGSRGKEAIRQSDLKLPMLKLGQDKSPAVDQHKVEIGEFFNNVTFDRFGKEVEIIPVAVVTGQMRFGKYQAGKVDIQCQAPDGLRALTAGGKTENGKATDNCMDCIHRLWGQGDDENDPPACNEQGRYLVIVPGAATPMFLSLQRTNMKAHKTIVTFLASSKHDSFAHKIKLTHVKHKMGALMITAQPAGYASEVDYRRAQALYESMAKSFVKSSVAGEGQEA